MSPAAEIFIIILSIVLTIFLIVGIVLLVYLIVLTRQIRKVTKSAEHTVEDFGFVVSKVSKVVQPIFVTETINSFIKKFKKKKKGED
jgi:heme/copper-type cytochrome/quinol oxidase subunit 2